MPELGGAALYVYGNWLEIVSGQFPHRNGCLRINFRLRRESVNQSRGARASAHGDLSGEAP